MPVLRTTASPGLGQRVTRGRGSVNEWMSMSINESRKVTLSLILMDELIMELEKRALQEESDRVNNLDERMG